MNNQKGFTLVEVMMAFTIFAVFVTGFVSTTTYNVNDSYLLGEEIKLKRLTENKLNEILLNPPQLTDALTLAPEVRKFEEAENQDYSYEITYQKLLMPSFDALTGADEDPSANQSQGTVIQGKVFSMMKKNIESIVWQIQVKVTNTQTQYFYTLSTWMINEKAKIDISFN